MMRSSRAYRSEVNPLPDQTFNSLPLRPELLAAIDALGYQVMTPIQAQALPLLLGGQDLLAQAQTGSGKTAAFAIGILNRLDPQLYRSQALVLCPTRELAEQVSNEIRRLARTTPNVKVSTLCGGQPLGPQLASLQRDPHIVVGTPGRILKHLQSGSLKFEQLTSLVLDEADRMLDMGFQEDILAIIRNLPAKRQTLLFSATYPEDIQAVSNAVQHNPAMVRVAFTPDSGSTQQWFYPVGTDNRFHTLVAALHYYLPQSSLVFCNQKQTCQSLADELCDTGLHAMALHGDMEQFDRNQVLALFANRSISILVATDVAARGLDISELDAVINYELALDPEVHIHRIGRTGRAGSEGLAISLFADGDSRRLQAIEAYQGFPARIAPAEVLESRPRGKLYPPMVTLMISGGRKDKLRAGDLLGALTANDRLPASAIGKITQFDKLSYVAIERRVVNQALEILSQGTIKGRKFRVRKLG